MHVPYSGIQFSRWKMNWIICYCKFWPAQKQNEYSFWLMLRFRKLGCASYDMQGGNLKVKHHTFLMMSSMNLCHISSSHVWSVNHQFGSLGVIWSQITSKSTVCSAVCWTVNTSKFRITDPFRDESTGNRLIPFTKGQLRGKCFHVMTS